MAIIQLLIFCAAVLSADVTGMTIDQMLEAAFNASGVGVQRSEAQEGGIVTVELDMKYTREEYQALRSSRHRRGKRQAVRLESKKWPNQTVPYKISFFTLHSEQMEEIEGTIQEAIDEWTNYTCINFRPATNADDNYVIFRDGDSCSSFVGMKTGIQDIELFRTCRQKRIVVHEIGHALGLHHHHMRPDRDDYVTINRSNVKPGFLSEFEKKEEHEVTTYGEPYDYLSVMHYGSKFFSYNQRPTIIAKDERFKDLIGNSPGVSFSDIQLVNYMYRCNEHCPPKTCPGEGFVGKDCECWCRGNTTAGRPVVKCTDVAAEPCLIPVDPDYRSNNCLYRYIKMIEKREKQLQQRMKAIEDDRSTALADRITAIENNPTLLPRDCAELYNFGTHQDGVYEIRPSTLSDSFKVFCDMTTDGGGWTVIQRRFNGTVIFARSWTHYKDGFGDLRGEFWLGNDYISAITRQKRYQVHVYLKDWDNDTRYATYSTFKVQPEKELYKLEVTGYEGNAGDSMGSHNGYKFSTYDKDNDGSSSTHYAQKYGGGFWLRSGMYVNPNGPYQSSSQTPSTAVGLIWRAWRGNSYSLKSTVMKVRPVDF